MYGLCNSSNQVVAEFVTPMSITSNVPVFSSDTTTLKRNVSSRAVQRWEISTKLKPLSETANELFALLVSKNTTNTMTIKLPQNTGSIKNRVLGSATATGNVNEDHILVTTSGTIPIGTFIKLGTKVYLTTSVISGNSISIFPPLQATFTSGNDVLYWQDDILMSVWLDASSVVGMAYTDGVLMDNGEMKFVEVL